MPKDLNILPRVRDGWSYVYIEHAIIEQDALAITAIDKNGRMLIPSAALSLLMLGPGTKITHSAIKILADNGCLIAWIGEEGVRFYALGMGETRSSAHLLRQAAMHCDADLRMQVVRRMYEQRFPGPLDPELTIQQIRGKEGVRVREMYAKWSRDSGVEWNGRFYKQNDWRKAQPINRAISAANSCLYGIAHAAIIALGYSPALGFIHTGKMLSFVYDVADLYKADLTIPVAFQCTAAGESRLESRVRHICRDRIREQRILERIVGDLDKLFTVEGLDQRAAELMDRYAARPGGLWDPEDGEVAGGTNYGTEDSE
ncbi:type I-E CRISPR-associated endonuclease Cas1e [Candidatus Viridilinea mediisalina]|uniref:CRISPR-associated endonuclease Cas1 n=1 Tax=Candidatus Viridilinea mediisalina TaxID=2024553 RepID=A0A2A6REH0_9CHLR|nr:type I-E CRISPR-associated endonuclease Cas1e [Candidatus Viridilinea mediisalina]PDW01457.1 subtype I-E CRISPR-associated endonuclease Cas1 [Candidatus Viridilinea mediisalina]